MIKYTYDEKNKITTAQFVNDEGKTIIWKKEVRKYMIKRFKNSITYTQYWKQVERMADSVDTVAVIKCNEKDKYSVVIGKELAKEELLRRWHTFLHKCIEKYISYMYETYESEKNKARFIEMEIFNNLTKGKLRKDNILDILDNMVDKE